MDEEDADSAGPSGLEQEIEQWELDSLTDTESSEPGVSSSSSLRSDVRGLDDDAQTEEIEQVELDSFSESSSTEGSDDGLHSRQLDDSDSDSSLVEKEDFESSENSGSSAPHQGGDEVSSAEEIQPSPARSPQPQPTAEPTSPPALDTPMSPPQPPDDDMPMPGWEELHSPQTPPTGVTQGAAEGDETVRQMADLPDLDPLPDDAPIGQRTRARNPLKDVTIEELEALLKDDLLDSDVEDDQAYQDFLKALQGGEDAEPGLLPEEEDDDDADFMLDLDELLAAGEEGLLDAAPPPSPLQTRYGRAAGTVGPSQQALQRALWVPQSQAEVDGGSAPGPLTDNPQALQRGFPGLGDSLRQSPDAAVHREAAVEARRRLSRKRSRAGAQPPPPPVVVPPARYESSQWQASSELQALAKAQAAVLRQRQEMREQHKRQERRRTQGARRRYRQGAAPADVEPVASPGDVDAQEPVAEQPAAVSPAVGQTSPARRTADASAPERASHAGNKRAEPRLTGAAIALESRPRMLIPGARAIPGGPQPGLGPIPRALLKAAWTTQQLAKLQQQVDSHLQLLCHVVSLLSCGSQPDLLQRSRALLLHMAGFCVQSMGQAELAGGTLPRLQPPTSRCLLAAPVLPHVMSLIAAVDAAGKQPQAEAGDAAALSMPQGVRRVLERMAPHLSPHLSPSGEVAAARGWTEGEVELLRLGLRRFGQNPPQLQKFFLPTKSLDSIQGYIKVVMDRDRPARSGPPPPLSETEMGAIRQAIKEHRGSDRVWDLLSTGCMPTRTPAEIKDLYWRQGYGAKQGWRAAGGPVQPAAAVAVPVDARSVPEAPSQAASLAQVRCPAGVGSLQTPSAVVPPNTSSSREAGVGLPPQQRPGTQYHGSLDVPGVDHVPLSQARTQPLALFSRASPSLPPPQASRAPQAQGQSTLLGLLKAHAPQRLQSSRPGPVPGAEGRSALQARAPPVNNPAGVSAARQSRAAEVRARLLASLSPEHRTAAAEDPS